MPLRVAADGDRRGDIADFPTRRLMATRNAPQEHAAVFELQKRVVPVQAANHVTQTIHDAIAEPLAMRLSTRGHIGTRRNRMGVIGHHLSCSSRRTLLLPTTFAARVRFVDFKRRA